MGQLLMTVAGAAAGFMIGGPMGAKIGMMIGSTLGSMLFSPTIKGPRLDDLTVTASTYGTAIPELYGTSRMAGNVFWSPGIKEHKKKKSVGKGGPKQTTYTYTASFAVAFCVGPATTVTRIWADTKLIVGDSSSGSLAGYTLSQAIAQGGTFGAISTIFGAIKGVKTNNINYRFYPGSETQLPDGIMVADKGAADSPAYRGLCYIVFEDMPLADYGNRIPSISAEITKILVPTAPVTLPLYGDNIPSGAHVSRVDYQAGLFYIKDGDEIQVYDLNTMTKISQYPFPYGDNYWMAYNGGPIGLKTVSRNSAPIHFFDSVNFAPIATLGHESNSLTDSPVPACSLFSQESPTFVGADAVTFFYTVDSFGQTLAWYFLHISQFGNYSVYKVGGDFVFIDDIPSAIYDGATPTVIQCATTTTGTDTVGWINKAGAVGFSYHRWTWPIGATGFVTGVQQGPDCFGDVCTNCPGVFEEDVIIGEIAGYQRFEAAFCLYDPTDNTLNMAGYYINRLTDGSTCPGFLRWSISDRAAKVARPWNVGPDVQVVVTHSYSGNKIDTQTTTTSTPFESIVVVTDGQTTTTTTTYFGDNNGIPIFIPTGTMDGSRLAGGTVGWLTGEGIRQPYATTVDLQTGAIQSFPITQGFFSSDDVIGGAWDDVTQSLFITDVLHLSAQRWFFRSYGGGTSLATIVEDICTKTTTLSAADVDVTALSEISVPGYVVSNNSTAKDCLLQLGSAYFFDAVESDYKLKFVPRGGQSALTLDQDDLAPVDGQQNASVKETAMQETELPMRVTINYYSQERDYQTGSQYAKRMLNPVPTMYSAGENKTDLPIVMTADTAKQMADKALKMSWTNRTTVGTTFPWANILLDPTDVISIKLADKGVSYNLRLDKIDIGVDYSLQATGVTERSIAYTSVLTGDSGAFKPVSAASAPPVDIFVLNTPLLRDLDDTQGNGSRYYVAIGDKNSTPSKGAIIEQSKTGDNYDIVTTLSSSATSGNCASILPSVLNGEATDYTSVLKVLIKNPADTLESVSYEDMIAGQNAAIVGNEIIQFMNADLGDDGFWTLTGLLRGRRGTQYAIRNHTSSERFVLLEPTFMETALHDNTDYVSKYGMKAVPPGALVDDTSGVVVNFQPNDLKPYTPEGFKCVSDSGTNTVTFNRRSRLTATLTDVVTEVPYKEGQGMTAHFAWQAFFNADLNDPLILAGTATPDQSGIVNVYSDINVYADLSLTFPFDISAHGSTPHVILRVWEVGFVDGFPKIVQFSPPRSPGGTIIDGAWNYAELY